MAEQKIGIYPGTFDPITNGHTDIIGRAARLLDKLVVGVAINPGKGPIFTIDERVELVREEIRHLDNGLSDRVEVRQFSGLLIDFAHQVDATVIIRGLRAVSDFDYEFQMSSMNAKMAPDVETVCLMASDKYQFIASSLVKEIAKLNGDVSQFVSPRITERLAERLRA
ncbi:MAG: pantetheine-phosphate adenylyltransferase [Alphaproteobacteria bacterium]